MKIRTIDFFVITSLVAHAAMLVNYLPENPGGIQSGNEMNITLEPVAANKKTNDSEKLVKQHAPTPETIETHKYNEKINTNKNILTKFVTENTFLTSSAKYKSDNSKNFLSQKNNEQSRSGHLLRNKINLLLANNFYYPPMARRNNWYGTVEISLRIEQNGIISKITLAKSSGYEVLDNAALANIKTISAIPEAHEWLGNSHYDMILPIEYRLIDS